MWIRASCYDAAPKRLNDTSTTLERRIWLLKDLLGLNYDSDKMVTILNEACLLEPEMKIWLEAQIRKLDHDRISTQRASGQPSRRDRAAPQAVSNNCISVAGPERQPFVGWVATVRPTHAYGCPQDVYVTWTEPDGKAGGSFYVPESGFMIQAFGGPPTNIQAAAE